MSHVILPRAFRSFSRVYLRRAICLHGICTSQPRRRRDPSLEHPRGESTSPFIIPKTRLRLNICVPSISWYLIISLLLANVRLVARQSWARKARTDLAR